jgi:hypothetical protein
MRWGLSSYGRNASSRGGGLLLRANCPARAVARYSVRDRRSPGPGIGSGITRFSTDCKPLYCRFMPFWNDLTCLTPNNAMQRTALNVYSWIQLFYRPRAHWQISLAPFPPSLIFSR